MIRPILATKDPYRAAHAFERCGWNIDFMTPPDGGDPLAGVSLLGNELLLGTMDEKYVHKAAAPHVGAGVELHILIPAARMREVYRGHACLKPAAPARQPWGETGFCFELEGYRFMVLAGGAPGGPP